MRRLTLGAIVALVLALVVLGGLGFSGVSAPSARGASLAQAPVLAAVQPAATHGDLVITTGETFVIQPPELNQTYYQGGNITVETGGTLIVRNTTLSFVQTIPEYGTLAQRVAGLYSFGVAGTADFFNSTVTTDVSVLNAYPKLPLTVTGTMSLWNSSLAFPGWVTITGATAALTLTNSTITDNPSVLANEKALPTPVVRDAMYAPTYIQSAGAHVGLFGSAYANTYADPYFPAGNTTFDPTFFGPNTPLANGNYTFTGYPQDEAGSADIAENWLYPSEYGSGSVRALYDSNSTGSGTATVQLYFLGTTYALGTFNFFPTQTPGLATLPITGAALNAINAAGRLAVLDSTPSVILSAVTLNPYVNITSLNLTLDPSSVAYDLNVTGAGTVLGTVDSSIDLNWVPNDLQQTPLAWQSNKLLIQDGAAAYLGNLTIPNDLNRTASASAVQPDNSSTVMLYRWGEFDLTGKGGTVPIYGATITAFSALPSAQSNNATANGANDIAAVDPAMWAYLQSFDAKNQYPGYGETGSLGTTALLLASTQLTGPNLPDGNYLGNYHIIVHLPIAKNNTSDFNWSVSPYPTGVALSTPGYGLPDFAPTSPFPLYYAEASVLTPPVVTTSGVPSLGGGVRIGQTIKFETTLTSIALAPITTIHAGLMWNNTTTVAYFNATDVPLTSQGSTYTFNVSWKVNDTITGLEGTSFNHTFRIKVEWNPNNGTGIEGFLNSSTVVTVRPSDVTVLGTSTIPNPIQLSQAYVLTFSLAYNGTEPAFVYLEATPTTGVSPIVLGSEDFFAGNFTLTWNSSALTAGTSYYIALVASFNGVVSTYNFVGQYTVPSTTSPTSFLYEKILGLPLWIWLAIAGAIVAGIVVALMLLRRTAAGKLVECGECGNLIPEDATVCPKCGAEFESDLVRCSRCASTIPANSSVCPECAALLLGTSAEAGEEAERQGYQDFTEKYRAEGKRELGENFNEGSFWDWWKRQPTYVPFNQWKLQQGQGTPRTGMTEPPAAGAFDEQAPPPAAPPPRQPPRGGAGAARPAAPATRPAAAPARPATPPSQAAGAGSAPAGTAPAGFKNCPGCGKEIPGDYLICPFCSSVVQ